MDIRLGFPFRSNIERLVERGRKFLLDTDRYTLARLTDFPRLRMDRCKDHYVSKLHLCNPGEL